MPAIGIHSFSSWATKGPCWQVCHLKVNTCRQYAIKGFLPIASRETRFREWRKSPSNFWRHVSKLSTATPPFGDLALTSLARRKSMESSNN
jgi:hypothetical protein